MTNHTFNQWCKKIANQRSSALSSMAQLIITAAVPAYMRCR